MNVATEEQLPLSAAQTIDIAKELVNGWTSRRASEANLRDGLRLTQFIGVFGVSAHCHRLAVAAVALFERGLHLESLPTIRSLYEHAITAAWMSEYPDAALAFVNAGERNRRKAIRTATQAGWGKHVSKPAGASPDLEPIASPMDPVASKFEQICDHLTPGGVSAYAVYRMLCAYSHPGPMLVDEYIEEDPLSLGVEAKEMSTPQTWMYMACCSLVWAGSAVDHLEAEHPRRQELAQLADRLAIEAHLRAAQ